jgi:predicted GNAT family N-acyltransferase
LRRELFNGKFAADGFYNSTEVPEKFTKTSMSHVDTGALLFSIVAFDLADPTWQQVYNLREEILRKPLGLSLKDEDLSGEQEETTIAAFDRGDPSTVVGCVMLRRLSAAEVKLRQMAVATSFQGQGIGRLLVQKAEEMARDSGCRIISLHARRHAVPFYEHLGYQVHGDVFTEVGIPHLFMNKSIHEVPRP